MPSSTTVSTFKSSWLDPAEPSENMTTSAASKARRPSRAMENGFARSTASSRSRSSNAGLNDDEVSAAASATSASIRTTRRASQLDPQRRKSMIDSVRQTSRRPSYLEAPTQHQQHQQQHQQQQHQPQHQQQQSLAVNQANRARAHSLAVVSTTTRRPSTTTTTTNSKKEDTHSVILRRRKGHGATKVVVDDTADVGCRSLPRARKSNDDDPVDRASPPLPETNDAKPIRLYDAWKDTLAMKQRLAKEDLHQQQQQQQQNQQNLARSSLLARRRSSVLASATNLPHQLLHTHHRSSASPSSPDTPRSASSSLQRRHITPPSTNLIKVNTPTRDAYETPSSPAASPIRSRKKSTPLDDATAASLARRRRSRTESLKDGVPTATNTANASNATTTTIRLRKKSIVSETVHDSTKPSSASVKKTVGPPSNYTRKRGKTLPGNLAKPPVLEPVALPPMKVEPIQSSVSKMIKTPQQFRDDDDTGASGAGIARPSTKKKPSPDATMASTRRPSMPQLASSKPTSTRRLSINASSKGGWAAYDASASASDRRARSAKAAGSAQQQQQQMFDDATATNTLQNRHRASIAVPTAAGAMDNAASASSSAANGPALSLQEKLQAMVAQHLQQHQDDAYTRDRRARKSQNIEMNRPPRHVHQHRMSEPFLFSNSHPAASPGANPADGQPIPLGKSPDAILQLYGPCLSAFEKQEIHDYDDIYFVGPYATKIQGHPVHAGSNNHGYDDDRGDYLIVRQDHLGYRYEILEELGRGSFGQVVKCFDHKTNMSVAIKLIRNKRRFHEQALTEVKILKDLVAWDPDDQHHSVRMTDYFYFRSHLCIVCECLSINLYEFIKKYDYKGFNISLIKRFALQLLHALCLLYDHGVIHCDLKPENILLKHPTKSTIKVIDFGSSCFVNERVYTYIQSRFYRAPEIILGASYDTAIDMWSFGCILAELYTGIPIFPGESEQEQLACIMEILDVPCADFINRCSRKKLFFDSNNSPRPVTNSRGTRRKPGQKSLQAAIPCKDSLFLDFICACLKWDPEERLSPYEALQHEWFTSSSKPA